MGSTLTNQMDAPGEAHEEIRRVRVKELGQPGPESEHTRPERAQEPPKARRIDGKIVVGPLLVRAGW